MLFAFLISLIHHKDSHICDGLMENQKRNMPISTTQPQTLTNHSINMQPQHDVMETINTNSPEDSNTKLSAMNINSVMLPRNSKSPILSELQEESRSVNHIQSQTTQSGR